MSSDIHQSDVYLAGDATPIRTTLTVEEVAAKILDATEHARDADAIVFLRLPLGDQRGDALVRPAAIHCVIPLDDDELDDDDGRHVDKWID